MNNEVVFLLCKETPSQLLSMHTVTFSGMALGELFFCSNNSNNNNNNGNDNGLLR